MADQKQSGFGLWVNQHIMPPIMKFVNTKAIIALQNGMVYSLPFIIIGSIFLILGNIPIKSVADAINASGWGAIFAQANNTTFQMMGLWAAIGIAYVYVKNENYEPLAPGLTSAAAFLMLQNLSIDNPLINAMSKGIDGGMSAKAITANIDKLPDALQTFLKSPVTGVINTKWLGGDGMIAAIIVGLLVGWIYTMIMKAGWTIKMPAQVPPAVSNQFTAMIPSGVILTGSMLIYAAFNAFAHTDFLNWIYNTLQIPLQGISDSFGGAIAIGFLVPFFWFFGVHGGLIMGSLVAPMLQANTADNARLFAEGKLTIAQGAHVVTNEFYNNFINLTGSGITIGLIIFTLVAAKSVQLKSIGKLELVPGIFNINEPFLFGLPIVMNPMLAVPFFLTPLVVAASTYLVIKTGIVPPLNGVAAPWTTPAVISGFLIGGWKMAIWQACTLLISTAIYWPFARKYDKVLLAKEMKEAKQEANK
ncbi:MAG: PTS sugar transporter subunit IIC [Lactobacillus crispatus]|jgi:PTS system cellobiose-specific IIC component|nr:PTS sugar transporter subunit IIC [Lactobacillus crispatus]MCI1335584.1 PTS sugar transporter subunit IIC [Lactobacillus crispatus]MCI1364777.1 PTS sugar transporter subunit IIC [Lactobacillus crispatus]MCI1493080.1 PTS sugar transporter subunit IIC [Lactobacillus crispatus]MCI1524262.1 PTS sugar transporter subunit IIC [Lactobacillus crispatus]